MGAPPHVPTPACPECLRTQQLSLVSEAGHTRMKVGEMTLRLGQKVSTIPARAVTTTTYRCSRGHQFSETNLEGSA